MSGMLTLKIEKQCQDGKCQCCSGISELKAEKAINTPVTNFTRYTHSFPNGSGRTFTLNGTLSNGEEIKVPGGSSGASIPNVESASVYYWSKNENIPLLLGITTGNTTTYYAKDNRGGNNWNLTLITSTSQSGKLLSEQLDYQNCQHNSAVTIDLSKGLSGGHHNYCCSGNHSDGSHGQKVSVTSAQISCTRHSGQSNLTYYKHEINTSGRLMLAGIKYNDSKGDRKRITAKELTFPIQGSLTVYAIYCTGEAPALIYVKSTGDTPVEGWFKQNADGNTWEKVSRISQDPENIKSCKDDSKAFDALMTELKKFPGCKNLGTCTPPPPPPDLPPQQPPNPSPVAEKLMGPTVAATSLWLTFGASSGTLTGAGGLTGLGWWMFKRSKGDPWVRHGYPIEFLKNVPY